MYIHSSSALAYVVYYRLGNLKVECSDPMFFKSFLFSFFIYNYFYAVIIMSFFLLVLQQTIFKKKLFPKSIIIFKTDLRRSTSYSKSIYVDLLAQVNLDHSFPGTQNSDRSAVYRARYLSCSIFRVASAVECPICYVGIICRYRKIICSSIISKQNTI